MATSLFLVSLFFFRRGKRRPKKNDVQWRGAVGVSILRDERVESGQCKKKTDHNHVHRFDVCLKINNLKHCMVMSMNELGGKTSEKRTGPWWCMCVCVCLCGW